MLTASTKAINAPVIDVVLVPPSAWITSQSIHMVFSPNAFKSTTERSALPISLCISIVLPSILSLAISLGFLTWVDLGNILYSAVIHPSPEPFKNGGTLSSIDAVHITLVSPTSINTDPSANLVYFLVILTGLICSFFLPSILMQSPSRIILLLLIYKCIIIMQHFVNIFILFI
ncbi:hypothetical protein D3C73_1076630 [compost metagenome]